MPLAETSSQYKKTACIFCSINCGLEVKTGGKDGRELVKIKGDRENVSSEGYVCNKPARLNHYQMGADRIDTPLRRRPDGTYEPVDWDTAMREVAAGLKKVQEQHGGDKIYFIGGGGQGNHLGGFFAGALTGALGVRYQTNALAQEKTGEFWVQGKMFGGGGPHGDFHHTEVAVFVGKNPWEAHGFPQTRKVLRAIARDPARSMIVLDPSLTQSAKLADYHLRVRPGTDAWCLSAMIATVVQEGLEDKEFVENHTTGFEAIRPHFEQLDIGEYAAICDVDQELIRSAARRIATAKSAAVFEDLGTQQNIHSTLVSYLQRALWVLAGHFGKRGGHNISVSMFSVTQLSKQAVPPEGSGPKSSRVSPVLGSKVITGLLPCSEMPDEILTDHPDRFRAAIILSTNPAHSYANAARIREAILALEFSVVVDVAMTETARVADYVLPASSQFEKHECTVFSVEFPRNHLHVRHPVVAALPGTLTEAEIFTRILEELGDLDPADVEELSGALAQGRQTFGMAFMGLMSRKPHLMRLAPCLLYRTLGPTLNEGRSAEVAPFWGLCHQFAQNKTQYAKNAGFEGSVWEIGEALFDAVLNRKSGFVYTDSVDYADSWERVGYADKRIRLHLQELFPRVQNLDLAPLELPDGFPLILAAGNRRGSTANTIVRDASWDRKGNIASLYMNPEDAEELQLTTGDSVKITTKEGSATTTVEVNDVQRQGTIALPNGLGLDYRDHDGTRVLVGVGPNRLTSSERKDFFAGTPWHKYVPARVEKVDA